MNLASNPEKKPTHIESVFNKNKEERNCADPRAIRSLIALMDMHAVHGGAACHWGGPSAIAECLSALHDIMFNEEAPWFERFNFVNDIGHAENAVYALRAIYGFGGLDFEDLRGFRSIESKLTGHGESHLYPEGVLLSNGPLGSAFPQAQGLAMADKKAKNDRITITTISDGACMEGEAKEAMAAIPGLHKKGLINPFVMIVSDNQTKLSGRIHDAFDMAPTFNSLEQLGWNVILVEKGNDLQSCYSAIERALEESQERPTCIRLKTIKGYGIQATEESASGGHGFPLKKGDEEIVSFIKELWNDNPPEDFLSWAQEFSHIPKKESPETKDKKEKMQAGFARALSSLKKQGLPVVSISSDLQGSTGVSPFHKEYPESSFDIGIAESNMVSTAAGFSKQGYLPIVDTFAAFGITKGNLPLIMASLSHCPITAIFSHTGFQDAADGASHQSLTYFAALASIPNVEVIAVSTSGEAEFFMEEAIKKQFKDKEKGNAKSYIFFVGRENFLTELKESVDSQRSWSDNLVAKGTHALIAATGPCLHQALEAQKMLQEDGINIGVINHRLLNNIDAEKYSKLIQEHNGVFLTVEDHQVAGGIGSFLIHQIVQTNPSSLKKVKSLGVQGVFGQSAYTAGELYSKHGLDARSITRSVKELLK